MLQTHDRAEHRYHTIKWTAEWALVPIHYLLWLHMYTTAQLVGALAFIAFGVASIYYAPRVPVVVEARFEQEGDDRNDAC